MATVRNLETDQGILASGKNELFGALFGRDSLITSLKLLKVYQQTQTGDLLEIVKKVLVSLCELQGGQVNIESGEEPGKCIHEFRLDNHERLTKASREKPWLPKPWYVYPDGSMRNYDTVDATSLFLITIYRYYQVSGDENFLKSVLPNVESSLSWIFNYGDSNGDLLMDYQLNPKRVSGGLENQNWMDSAEATFHEDGEVVTYPIASVEVQAYTYLALRLWAKYYRDKNAKLADRLFERAYGLKEKFNEKFLVNDESGTYLAFAIDGAGKPLTAPRSSMGHCLWASLSIEEDGEIDSILEPKMVKYVVSRLFQKDLFEKNAGIRTLSSSSKFYDPDSYHNGSIWPHDNSMIIEGLEKYGYIREAQAVKKAILAAYDHFQTPVELFVYDEGYRDYLAACRTQAWSAAAILRIVSKDYASSKEHTFTGLHLRQLTTKAINWLFVYN